MTEIQFVYITTGDMNEARVIGKALVEKKLAACVNFFDGMNSIYQWEGELQEGQETVLIAKTTEENIPALKKAVTTLHSYECPCIVCLPVIEGNQPFLKWIKDQVS